ncbi:unnamed protein product [Allacma fusca]|uniref:Uncharacterized protein n=1 Tax=Allacma fusca TaxID=39272 RepID=A0A8J2JS89_9HEXA|nr:unnamed protein product [Allacma fusca]
MVTYAPEQDHIWDSFISRIGRLHPDDSLDYGGIPRCVPGTSSEMPCPFQTTTVTNVWGCHGNMQMGFDARWGKEHRPNRTVTSRFITFNQNTR